MKALTQWRQQRSIGVRIKARRVQEDDIRVRRFSAKGDAGHLAVAQIEAEASETIGHGGEL